MPRRLAIESAPLPPFSPDTAPRLRPVWFLAAAAGHAVYLAVFYYLLSVENAFNFNNNYPVLGFLTCLTVLIALAILVLAVSEARPLAEGRPDHSQTTFFFVASLSLVAFLVLPVVYYFMLLDDFAVTARQWLSAGLALAAMWLAWRGWWRHLASPRGLLVRAGFGLLCVVLVLLMMNMLCDVIPTPAGNIKENVLLPL
ncbi:MAG: hypothetical protein AB1439_00775 [candidate division FCPU426 bacterium]